jgi:hypothetical protein
MKFIDIIGVSGIILFFIKVVIHIYIKRNLNSKFSAGAFGQFTNPVLFWPITDSVTENLRIIKTIGNVIYIVAIILIVLFLVAINLTMS